MTSFVQVVGSSLLMDIPELVAWLFGVVLAVIMVRRGGGGAERLMLAGCCLMFVAALSGSLLSGLVQSLLFEEGMSNISRAEMIALFVSVPVGVLSLAGFVCLVFAFWKRFKVRGRVPA
jgi:drug/metabolite transporter (DMT)-like permease